MSKSDEPAQGEVITSIIRYSLCSSTLLLANKLAMGYLPYPGLVSVLQLTFATIFILVSKFMGWIVCDDLEEKKIKPYLVYVMAFVFAIFTNFQALQKSNIETVIVFRACAPLATTVIEYNFMGREWPSSKSLLSLFAVAFGAVMYCLSDSQLALEGYSAYYWVSLYYVLIIFEMTYGKQLTKSVKMDSPWGSTLYCNLFAILPMAILGWGLGDINTANAGDLLFLNFQGCSLLLFSCLAGVGIGYSGWHCRSITSATTYTLVGVVNKFLTILLTVLLSDKHASNLGLFAVCTCLAAGSFYKQAPLRSEKTVTNLHEVSIQK